MKIGNAQVPRRAGLGGRQGGSRGGGCAAVAVAAGGTRGVPDAAAPRRGRIGAGVARGRGAHASASVGGAGGCGRRVDRTGLTACGRERGCTHLRRAHGPPVCAGAQRDRAADGTGKQPLAALTREKSPNKEEAKRNRWTNATSPPTHTPTTHLS